MDTILEDEVPFFLYNAIFDDSDEVENKSEKKLSLWIKDKDTIRATTDISLTTKIDPGVYTADFSKDYGYYCKKLNSESDELFVFSDSITQKLFDEIDLFWTKASIYAENKLIHKRGILLEGFPGTGKSSIITIFSNKVIQNGGVVFKITGYRNLSDYIEFIQNSFRKLQPDTPIITIIEDIDQYDQVELELLDFLDGKTHLNHHVVIATTNNTEDVPDTFLRPSRMDLKIEIPLPCKDTRREYFTYKEIPSVDITELVEKSEGFSLADLKELYICIYLLDYTVDDAINKIASPRQKKNYLTSPINKVQLGL